MLRTVLLLLTPPLIHGGPSSLSPTQAWAVLCEISRPSLSWCENLPPGGRSPVGSAVFPVLEAPRDRLRHAPSRLPGPHGAGPSPLPLSLFSTPPASRPSSPFAELRHKPGYHFRKIAFETSLHNCLFRLSVYLFPLF